MANIMGDKYKSKYHGASDWIGELIDKVAVTPVEGKKAGVLNLDNLFKFAQENHVDTTKYAAQVGGVNAPGRIRMTVGNMLRARARKRHGLYVPGADGKPQWTQAPTDFIMAAGAAYAEPTETAGGARIAKPKAEKAAKETESQAA